MAKPTEIPTWATDAGATSDPGPTHKARGFQPGKRCPAGWLNWVLSKQGAWLNYLANLQDETEFLNKSYAWLNSHSWGDASIGGGIVSAHEVYIDSLKYREPAIKELVIPLESFQNYAVGGWNAETNGNQVSAEAAPARMRYSFRLPTQHQLAGIVACINQLADSTVTITVFRLTRAIAAPYLGARIELSSATSTTPGQSELVLAGDSDYSDAALHTYQVDVYSSIVGCGLRSLVARVLPQGDLAALV